MFDRIDTRAIPHADGYDANNELPDKTSRIEAARELSRQGGKVLIAVTCAADAAPHDYLSSEAKRLHAPTEGSLMVGPLVFELDGEPFVPRGMAVWHLPPEDSSEETTVSQI